MLLVLGVGPVVSLPSSVPSALFTLKNTASSATDSTGTGKGTDE